jgi:hypothetical protein
MRAFVAAAILLWVPVSVEADVPPQFMIRAEIGPEGGSLEQADERSPIRGARIVVPRGALQDRQQFSSFSAPDQCPNLPASLVDAGAPVDILPIAVPFDRPVTIRVPLPATHVPNFARHPEPISPRLMSGVAQLWARGDAGWTELRVTGRSEHYLETEVDIVLHGCFVPVVDTSALEQPD